MIPQLQCPNCNQFELGFRILKQESLVDHQKQKKDGPANTAYIRCAAFDCGYTGKPEEFNVVG